MKRLLFTLVFLPTLTVLSWHIKLARRYERQRGVFTLMAWGVTRALGLTGIWLSAALV